MAEKRTKIDIIGDMLVSIINKGGQIKPTPLMYKSNLSYKQLKNYLQELLEKDFIKKAKNKGKELIIITDKGRDFVSKLRDVKEFENFFGLT